MDKKNSIEFTDEQFNRIIEYKILVDASTVQNAILNAISIAMDDQDA